MQNIQLIEELISSCPLSVDHACPDQAKLLIEIADKLVQHYNDQDLLNRIEQELVTRNDDKLVFFLLALKIATSKLCVQKIREPLQVSIVFAMYKEHQRILPKLEHPHGENFLLKKFEQLENLFVSCPQVKWELIAVDDGCPEKSGEIAQSLIEQNKLQEKVSILFLQDAIDKKLSPTKKLRSVNESQKGASIIYGLWHASRQSQSDNHIIVYTDADLSTHLGQLGLLLEPLFSGENRVAIGSRRESNSVVVKERDRDDRGKLFIYLWKKLLPSLSGVVDSQCGFKAFRSDLVASLVEGVNETKFAFDLELLLKAKCVHEQSITKVPIAWIDSEAASTTKDLRPYLPMLQSIVLMYRKYERQNKQADECATFIKGLTEETFQKLVENIPREMSEGDVNNFDKLDVGLTKNL